MSRLPTEYNYLHGKVILVYSYPYDSKHEYCPFGHIYPHLHFIVEAINGRKYLVCGATGKTLLLDNVMDDIRFLIEAEVVKLKDIVELAIAKLSAKELEEVKKTIEKRLQGVLNKLEKVS